MASGITAGHLPAGPLLQRVEARGGASAAGGRRDRGVERALLRAQASGTLTVYAADRLAVRLLGLTPAEIWGRAWYDA